MKINQTMLFNYTSFLKKKGNKSNKPQYSEWGNSKKGGTKETRK